VTRTKGFHHNTVGRGWQPLAHMPQVVRKVIIHDMPNGLTLK